MWIPYHGLPTFEWNASVLVSSLITVGTCRDALLRTWSTNDGEREDDAMLVRCQPYKGGSYGWMVAKFARRSETPFGEGGSYLKRTMFAGSISWGMRWRVEKNMMLGATDLAYVKCGGAVLFQKVSSRSPAVIPMPGLSSFGKLVRT